MMWKTQLLLGIALSGLFATVDRAFAQDNGLPTVTTINNPSPAGYDNFGQSVAGLGNDRVVVGANGAGAAYLFSQNGMLLTTFVNPDAVNGGGFGGSVATVGSNFVLVGASDYSVGLSQVGRAYLFTTNGTLVTTFTNPAPATIQALGWAVTGMGSDHVLVSGLADINKPAPYPGGVYLFGTNGSLLKTFINPHPASDAGFGVAVAAVENDRVLIGAPYDNTGAKASGSAYLFCTNGTMLTAFTNPIPVADDNFGSSVAAAGSGSVVIGSIDYGATKGTGGAAYLFNTNGALLATFTNPAPANYAYFGWSVAAVGATRVLIGAYQDGTGAFQAGSAYLFSTNGALLASITNPAPANADWFGASVAALGRDQLIVGAVWDSAGATHAGSAYLFALPYPPQTIALSAGIISVRWISAETGLVLQQADQLDTPTLWSDTAESLSVNGLTNTVQQMIGGGTISRFYRLRRQ